MLGPISSPNISLLRVGDVMLRATGAVGQIERVTNERIFYENEGGGQIPFIYLGRPDNDGWMPWMVGANWPRDIHASNVVIEFDERQYQGKASEFEWSSTIHRVKRFRFSNRFQKPAFKVGDIVRLKKGVTQNSAQPGATATVRKLPYSGYDWLDVVWDKTNPLWNNQRDGGYNPKDFDLVEPQAISKMSATYEHLALVKYPTEIALLKATLVKAMTKFEVYSIAHSLKHTKEGDAKAKANQDMADEIRKIL